MVAASRGTQDQYTTLRVGGGGRGLLRPTELFGGQKFNDVYMMNFTSETLPNSSNSVMWSRITLRYIIAAGKIAFLTWQLSSGQYPHCVSHQLMNFQAPSLKKE